jgi:hypothetical protein
MTDYHFGADCPDGLVQVEFVDTDGERLGAYGYKPGKTAIVELYVGGRRFTILAGTAAQMYGRHESGLIVMSDVSIECKNTAINSTLITLDQVGERIWRAAREKR